MLLALTILTGLSTAQEAIALAQLPELSLGTPHFQTADTGWTASFKGGLARVYVAPHAEALDAWQAHVLTHLKRRKPQPFAGLGDAAWGDGDDYVLVRQGLVGVLVEARSDAAFRAEGLLMAVEPAPAWPMPPTLRQVADGSWIPSDAHHLSYQGGQLRPNAGLVFDVPPNKLVAWDDWGRATTQWFDEAGIPMEPPEPPEPPPEEPAPVP